MSPIDDKKKQVESVTAETLGPTTTTHDGSISDVHRNSVVPQGGELK